MNPDNPPPAGIRGAIEADLFGRAGAEWRAAGGGLSSTSVWRASLGGNAFAVRRWPAGDRHAVRRLALTRAAGEHGLAFVAAPREHLIDPAACWESCRWIEGTPLSERADDEQAIAAAFDCLARLHRAFAGRGRQRSAAIAKRRERLLLAQQPLAPPPGEWRDLGSLLAQRLPEASRIAARLLDAAAPTDQVPGATLVHGDARPEHFLLVDRGVTGLIDFGALAQDHPAVDVARLAGELARGDRPRFDRLLDHYEAAGEAIDRRLAHALDASGAAAAACNWLVWLSEPGIQPRDPGLVRERLGAILARLPAE